MKHISLFSGIGGFDLASDWMGWENIASCEIADFPNKILEYYWPNANHHRNIYDTDFTLYRGKCNILTGGFPCQPFSAAGKRKGTEDSRHLWPQMLRAIREVRPTWIVGENVLGIVNWSKGLVFEQVQIDLENEGYEVQAFVLPAASLNAPHRRDRVWFVAYTNERTKRPSRKSTRPYSSRRKNNDVSSQRRKQTEHGKKQRKQTIRRVRAQFGKGIRFNPNTDFQHGNLSRFRSSKISQFKKTSIFFNSITYTNSARFQKKRAQQQTTRTKQYRKLRWNASQSNGLRLWRESHRIRKSRFINQTGKNCNWQDFPTESPICSRNDGISEGLDFETVFAGIPRPRKPITFSKWRQESIKGFGNAIVPQVALQIFKSIEQYESNIRK